MNFYKSLDKIVTENNSRKTLFQSQRYELEKLDKKLEEIQIELNSRKNNIENIPGTITENCNFLKQLANIQNLNELKCLYHYYGANYLITPNMLEQIMWTFPKHILNKKKIKTAVKTLWERTTWQKLNNEKNWISNL